MDFVCPSAFFRLCVTKYNDQAEVSNFLSLSCNNLHETWQVFWPRADFSPKLLLWLHSVIVIWAAPVKIELIYSSPSFPITLITSSDTLIWMGERHVRVPIGVSSAKCFMCKGDVRKQGLYWLHFKVAADFSGLELIYGFSRAIHRDRAFYRYLTIPFCIGSSNPEGNKSDLQDEMEFYLFQINQCVIRTYWISGYILCILIRFSSKIFILFRSYGWIVLSVQIYIRGGK